MAGFHSLIAQLVERRTVNPQVPGSSPGRGATNKGFASETVLSFSVARLSHGFAWRTAEKRLVFLLPYPS